MFECDLCGEIDCDCDETSLEIKMDEKYKNLEKALREILSEVKYIHEESDLIEFIDNILYED